MDRALLGRRVAPVHVHHVRNRVEGEERDADRQQHARHDERARVQREQQRADVVGEEIGVLEYAEDDEVQGDGDRREVCEPSASLCRRAIAIAIQ